MAPDTATTEITTRRRGRPRKREASFLPTRLIETDEIIAEMRDPSRRYTDDELADRLRITPAMVYNLRAIVEGTPLPPGVTVKGVIEGFELCARYGHAPAKGGAKALPPESSQQVVIIISPPAPVAIATPVETKAIDVTPIESTESVSIEVAATRVEPNA